MSIHRALSASLLAAGIGMGAPALAGDAAPCGAGASSAPSGATAGQGRMASGREAPKVRFDGEILGLRVAGGAPEGARLVLAKVELASGRTAVLNLGPAEALRARGPSLLPGQRISGVGRLAEMHRFPVLVVHRLAAGPGSGQAAAAGQAQGAAPAGGTPEPGAARGGAPEGRTPQQTMAGRVLVRGTVQDVRDVTLKGVPDKHRLIKIATPEGRHVIADLGTGKGFQDLNLQQGDRVVLLGEAARINDRPVVKARFAAELVALAPDRSAGSGGASAGEDEEADQG